MNMVTPMHDQEWLGLDNSRDNNYANVAEKFYDGPLGTKSREIIQSVIKANNICMRAVRIPVLSVRREFIVNQALVVCPRHCPLAYILLFAA